MIKLSFWAKAHYWQARGLMVVGNVLFAVIGLNMGMLLASVPGLNMDWIEYPAYLLMCLGFGLFPLRKEGRSRLKTYRRRLLAGNLIHFAIIALWLTLGYRLSANIPLISVHSESPSIFHTVAQRSPASGTHLDIRPGSHSPEAARTLPAKEKKGIKNWLKKRMEKRAAKRPQKLWVRVFIFCMLLTAALVLGYYLVGLACYLYCFVAEAAAVLVLNFGAAAIVTGMIFAGIWLFSKTGRIGKKRKSAS